MKAIFRELTDAEIAFVAGGEAVWDGSSYVVVGPGGGYTGGGGGSGGNGYSTVGGTVPDGANWGWGPSATPPKVDLVGRECPADVAAAKDAISQLYSGSSTARALIDNAAHLGVDVSLIYANNVGQGAQDRYSSDGSRLITWDPFQSSTGVNLDGSTYVESPIMLLAHEFVHAGHADDPSYQGPSSENLVMSVANQIAREMNAANPNLGFETNRTSHVGTTYYVDSIYSTTATISRPDCPP